MNSLLGCLGWVPMLESRPFYNDAKLLSAGDWEEGQTAESDAA